jgi:DNA-binding LacI/PurR family transcriptional regulator
MNERAFVPIYQRLFEFYKERIIKQEYLPGVRIDSINRIMRRHSVSRETAKLVLNKLSEEGFIIKKAGKGSFVTYTREIKRIWGMLIPFYSTNIEDLIANLNEEAQKVNRSFKYFLHYNEPEEEIRLVGNMLRQGYEAIIIVPNYDESLTANFYRNLNQGNSVILLVDNTMGGSFFSYVIQSYDLGVKRAIAYLISKNDKNLLFVKNEAWRGRNLVYELIEQSMHVFLTRHSPDRKLYVISGLSAFNQGFIEMKNIGGILCSTDVDSLKVTGRLNRWGIKIPDQISVVSYGNTELTRSASPQITSVDCRYAEMAKLTASLIFDCNPKITKQYVIQPEVVVRQT